MTQHEPIPVRTGDLRAYLELVRPFTLLAPAFGMITGGVIAFFSTSEPIAGRLLASVVVRGAMLAALLNAASNSLNQVCDVVADRVNKPHRPIPSGRVSRRGATALAVGLYLAALGLAASINLQCFVIAGAGALLTLAYSLPPVRTKRLTFGANMTIAASRGLLLPICGWSTVRSVWSAEPWYIGLVFFLFILGAASTKDFSDVAGDAADGCRTLPVRYGPRRSAVLMSPFLVLPFLMMPIGAWLGVLQGHRTVLAASGLLLTVWGAYIASLVLRNPTALARGESHPAWRHMYVMMIASQGAFVVAYMARG